MFAFWNNEVRWKQNQVLCSKIHVALWPRKVEALLRCQLTFSVLSAMTRVFTVAFHRVETYWRSRIDKVPLPDFSSGQGRGRQKRNRFLRCRSKGLKRLIGIGAHNGHDWDSVQHRQWKSILTYCYQNDIGPVGWEHHGKCSKVRFKGPKRIQSTNAEDVGLFYLRSEVLSSNSHTI